MPSVAHIIYVIQILKRFKAFRYKKIQIIKIAINGTHIGHPTMFLYK